MKRNMDNSVLSRNAGTVDGKIDIKDISWFIHHYNPSVIIQDLFNQQILTKMPTEIPYIKRSLCSKHVQKQIEWNFDFGVGGGIDLLIYVIEGFQ